MAVRVARRELLPGRVAYTLPWLVAVGPAALFTLLLLGIPSLVLLVLSVAEYRPPGGVILALSLANYARIFRDPFYLEVALNTLRVGAIVTLAALVFGYPIAYFLARSRSRLAAMMTGLVIAPLFVSVVIRSFGWMVLLARQGIVNSALLGLGFLHTRQQFLFTDAAVVIGLVHILSPFMILPITAVLRGIDPAIEEAARNLGAGDLAVMRWIVLPLSLPGVVAGATLVYAMTISAFILPAMLGSIETKLMATLLYQQVLVIADIPMGAALAVGLVAMTLLMFWAINRIFGIRAW